jgi:hypothetical protein
VVSLKDPIPDFGFAHLGRKSDSNFKQPDADVRHRSKVAP